MHDAPRPCPEPIIAALFELFRRKGIEGVSISDIGAATGLGRSSLYHYFPGGKDEMAAAVIDYARAAVDREMIAPLKAGGPLSDRFDRMIEGARRLYADGPCVLAGLTADGVGGALATKTSAVFCAWIEAITAALEEPGTDAAVAASRANAAAALIQGGLVLARATGDPWRFDAALRTARDALGH